MKEHLLVSPALDIVDFIGTLLLENKDILTQNIIVFPGKRPAHFLRKYIADSLKAPFKPPHIFSIDEFIDDFLCDKIDYHDQQITKIDGVSIIFGLNQNPDLISGDKEKLTLDNFLPWGFKIFSDFEEMYIEGIVSSQIKEIDVIAGEKLPARIQTRLSSLSRLYTAFYEYCGHHNLSTRALRYRKAADAIDKVDFDDVKNVIMAGFFALTQSERRIFQHLSIKSNVHFIFQKGPGIESVIRTLHIDVKEKLIENKKPEIQFYQAMDVHGEIFKLNRILRKRRYDSHKDLIVLPLSDTLFPIVQHTVGFTEGDYNISMGYPLYRTPIHALLEILGKLLETRNNDAYFISDYLKFVLHPYIKNIFLGLASYPTRIIFHTIEDHFKSQQKKYITLEEIAEDKTIIKTIVRRLDNTDRQTIKNHLKTLHQTLIEPFETIHNIEDFADKLLNSISFISQNSQVNRHPYTVPFIKTMIDALYELKTSGLRHETFTETTSYFKLLRNYVRTVRYPFSGTPVKGLQILGFLETRNIKFDTVYLLDANEGILPHTKKEDTLLPYKVRKYLGLPTHEEREHISRYYFETLLAGAQQTHIFYVESADKEKSRFVERLLWQAQMKNKTLEVPRHEVFFDVQFSQKDPAPVKKTADVVNYIAEKITFTPSRLDVYLQCPLRFYYENILKLTEKRDITDELEQKDIGNIVHTVLQKFFIQKVGEKLVIKESDYKNIEDITESEFKETYAYSEGGPLYLIKLQIKKRMRHILDLHKQEAYQDTIILECENQKNPHTVPTYRKLYEIEHELVSGYKIKLRGRIDRVDKRKEQIYIIDYKTGTSVQGPNRKKFDLSKRENWYKTLGSVQLPFYVLLYTGKNNDIRIKDINSTLLLLGGKNIEERPLFTASLSVQEKETLFRDYKEAIFTLIQEILDPKVDLTPTPDPENQCYRCVFKTICGRQWMVKKW